MTDFFNNPEISVEIQKPAKYYSTRSFESFVTAKKISTVIK